MLVIPDKIIVEIILKTVNTIISHIKKLLDHPKLQNLDCIVLALGFSLHFLCSIDIFLVGGFAENVILQNLMTTAFSSDTIKVRKWPFIVRKKKLA